VDVLACAAEARAEDGWVITAFDHALLGLRQSVELRGAAPPGRNVQEISMRAGSRQGRE
jgi:hypothetical protein